MSNRFEDNEQSITLAGDDELNPTRLRTTFTVEANSITGFGAAPIPIDGVVVYTGAGGVFAETRSRIISTQEQVILMHLESTLWMAWELKESGTIRPFAADPVRGKHVSKQQRPPRAPQCAQQ
jgi:hypothetical protein